MASQAMPTTQADRGAAGQRALGLTPETLHEEVPEQVARIRETARQVQAKIDDYASTREPAEEPDTAEPGPAWNVQARRRRDAILQPPKPDIVPASQILERAHDRQADIEPGLE